MDIQDQARIAAQVGAVAFVLHWLTVPRKSHQPRTLSPKTELSLVDCICMARELQGAWHGGSDPVSGHDMCFGYGKKMAEEKNTKPVSCPSPWKWIFLVDKTMSTGVDHSLGRCLLCNLPSSSTLPRQTIQWNSPLPC